MGPPTPPYVSLRPKVGPDTCSRRCHLAAGCLTQIRLASCSISLSLLHLTPFADCPSQQTGRTSLPVNLLRLVPILQSLFAEIASHLPISCCLAFPWSWPGSLKGSAKWGVTRVVLASWWVTHKGALPGEAVHTALLRLNPMSARPTNHYTTLHPGPRPLGPTSSGPRKQMARVENQWQGRMKTLFFISVACHGRAAWPRQWQRWLNRIEAGIGSRGWEGAELRIEA